MNTAFLLMAQYQGKPIIPVSDVCRDFFSHLTTEKFLRKVGAGEIILPLVRMEASQKAAKGVHLNDLASYLDARHEKAVKECQQLNGR
ncbi:pyocin activator PrtN family protein [Agrobacterium tumefaciens]|uniref:pyocin activator PrtN family protein n=1 Tax=Agrobacterium tumefaciens TaxID=358 RepID=UPI001573CBDF|nr:Pyocin activator protein PrtN [Agrobacterium tumefaciens]